MGVKEEEYWHAGTPLDDAWLEFIDLATPGWGRRENYRALLRPAREESTGEHPDLPWTTFEPKDPERRELRREHWERSFKEELLLALRQGLLLAYGKLWLPERSEQIELVSNTLFDPDAEPVPELEWKVGFVSARGRAYDDIRVVTPVDPHESPSPVKRRGPRSFKPEIEEIARDLIARNSSWLHLPARERRTQVIREAKIRNKSLSGNSPKGFSRTIIDEVCNKILLEKT
jgi:hypothetical protein